MKPIDIARLRWGDWIQYTKASGWYHKGKQSEEDGPYIGGIVGFEEDHFGDIIQVRADGWMGDEPIYALRLCDILAVLPTQRNAGTDAPSPEPAS